MTVFARPGSAGALMSYESRYDNFIGGEWVAPAKGLYFENPTPVTGPDVLRSGPLRRGRRRQGARRRPCRGPGVGQDGPGRARGDPEQDRRPHRGKQGSAGGGRGLGQRQTGPRGAGRRHPVGSRPFPLFRRGDPRPGGVAEPDRRRHRRLPLPRAARGGGPDHSVELPDPDGRLETGAGAGGRQHGGAQARRADAGLDPVSDVADRRPAAARRGQRRQRFRRGSRQAAGIQRPHRQGLVHRGNHHRATDHAVRLAEPDPGHPRTRRQEPQHLLLRRDGRQRRLPGQGAGRVHHVRPQPGRGVHLPVAQPDPVRHPRRVPGIGGDPDQGRQAGRPAGHRRPCWARRRPTTSWKRSCPTSKSARKRAPS